MPKVVETLITHMKVYTSLKKVVVALLGNHDCNQIISCIIGCTIQRFGLMSLSDVWSSVPQVLG
jgi:hypothetical protein